MYIPNQFEVADEDEIFAFLQANAFGQLISSVDGRYYSTHLPFLASKDRSQIIGHLAGQNPQHLELHDQPVLITLLGPHDYVSPSWYTGPGVPTWNYQAVHIYGQCRVFHDVDRLGEVVDALADKYESTFESPWQPDYDVKMLSAIVGIEVTISEIQCKYKLSQNRPVQDQRQVIEQLRSLGSHRLADAMDANGR